MAIEPRHVVNAGIAKALYLDALNPKESAADWRFALREARRLIGHALRSSAYLRDMEGALTVSAAHSLVFRQLLAPPMSQDQFKLVCPLWSKGAENNGRPLAPLAAKAAAVAIAERLDRSVVGWAEGGAISRQDLVIVLRVASTLMALQKVATARRNRLAFEQEFAVVELLVASGWDQLASKMIDTRAAVPRRSFMHKTRFATNTTTGQEVDIACGLKNSYVLAMECKVTNDETNSVKRVNDVLKKATAWKDHWGNFVKTAGLLQGVIAPKDVQRLTDARVEVFWSHDLVAFKVWLDAQL